MQSTWIHGDEKHTTAVRPGSDGLTIDVGGTQFRLERLESSDPGEVVLRNGDRIIRAYFAARGDERWLHFEGRTYHFTLERAGGRSRGGEASEGDLTSPMPGKVIEVRVEEGQAVKSGQSLLVIEAMKMEYDIAAPFDGTVAKVHFAAGDMVDAGATLVEIQVPE
ncbi:MAG: biotin/lipoyl-containing protein [Planctomycetota bacterium]